jgi:hypothetical protein
MTKRVTRYLSAGLTIAALLCTAHAFAHHAFSAEFDVDSPVVIRGRVSRVEWINPHAWIHVESNPEHGPAQHWMFETGTPNTLARSGLTRFSLPVGAEIVVRGYRSKDPACEPACRANGRDIMFADGRKVFVGSSGTGAPRDGLDPVER